MSVPHEPPGNGSEPNAAAQSDASQRDVARFGTENEPLMGSGLNDTLLVETPVDGDVVKAGDDVEGALPNNDLTGASPASPSALAVASRPAFDSPPDGETARLLGDDEMSFQAIGQTPLLPPREPVGARLAAFMGRHHTLLFVLSVLAIWAITSLPSFWHSEIYQRGSVAPHDIIAPHSAMLLDRAETRSRQEEAAALVPPKYDGDTSAQTAALTQLRLIAGNARSLATSSTDLSDDVTKPSRNVVTAATRRLLAQRLNARLRQQGGNGLPTALAEAVISVPPLHWREIERITQNAVSAVYAGAQIRSDVNDDLLAARVRIDRSVRAYPDNGIPPTERALAATLVRHVANRPNLVVNTRETEREREKARYEVRSVYQRVEVGTPLIRAGEFISDDKWAQLQEMDLVTPNLDSRESLARFALCVLLAALSAGFLSYFHPRLIQRPASLWLVAVIPILFLAIFRSLLHVPHTDQTMVPLAAVAAMLLTVLLDARVGLLAGFFVPALCAMMARTGIWLFLAASLSSWIGTLSVANISSRFQVVRAGALLAVTNAVLAAMLGVFREAPSDEIVSMVVFGAGAGVFTVVATTGLAMFLERPFGITTHLRLLDLLSPDEPVMRRMQAEAPGTYTHSLMVATLSETAAKSIENADALLCRVGALYHDIGKLRRPHCFVENQSGNNIHDRLSPQLSALVIQAHVKDGLELGRALRLPRPVLDIIAQHHGTSLISYFYHRALQQAEDASSPSVAPELFRYAGPRPQTKEAAIVMLADSIEASSRSLANPTPERLKEHIKTMIANRLQEGELSDSDLTQRDLSSIEENFAHVLRGVLHHRIEYPGTEQSLQNSSSNGFGLNDHKPRGGEKNLDSWMRKSRPSADGGPSTHGSSPAPTNGTNGTAPREAMSKRAARRLARRQEKSSVASPVSSTPGSLTLDSEANGTAAHGMALNGKAAQDVVANGTAPTGSAIKSTAANGTAPNGSTANGTTANGSAPKATQKINDSEATHV